MAALLILALMLAGVGRGLAAVSESIDPPLQIALVGVPICHASGDEAPHGPVDHACCDACALLGLGMLPMAPSLSKPVAVVTVLTHRKALSWAPVLTRFRAPRQSQGPPAA